VTGLSGHAYGSWRSRESKHMWLKDFLPKDVQGARVMSYGYNTKLFGPGTVETNLLDYARGLVEELENARGSVFIRSFFDIISRY
jgi:hypothetical protein